MRTALLSFLIAGTAMLSTAADGGRPSPAMSILRPGDAPIEVKGYRGKVVLLAFIDTHCPHCQALTNFLNQLAPTFAPRGVQIIECAFNDDAQSSLADFERQFHPAFPIGYSNRASVLSYLQISIMDPHPLYVPHLVFLDRKAVIRLDVAGESEFMKAVETNIPAELELLLKASTSANAKK